MTPGRSEPDAGAPVDWAHRAGQVAFAAAAAAMIATPLLPRGRRAVAASAVVAGLAGATGAAAVRRWGARRAAVAFATVAAATTMVEKLGTATGAPFGRYRYTGALRPAVGGVPVLVPLAWYAMALPARDTAHAALGPRSTRSARVIAGGAALAAWDLFLDPQMVSEGYWRWDRPGRYRGIPLSNYAGWLATAAGLMALLEHLAPPDQPPPDQRPPAAGTADGADRALVALYGWMAVMETVGFAAFFRDRRVALAGGAAMLPLAVVGARRAWARG